MVLSGDNPGGPVDWFADSLEPAFDPVLKGGLLAARAFLVRNFVEEAFSTDDVTTEGDEIQLILLTNGIISNARPEQQEEGVTVGGINSPTGFGIGTTAVDRYRLNGKPMFWGRTRVTPDPETIPMAPFPGREDDA
jgi:hypothetical protein